MLKYSYLMVVFCALLSAQDTKQMDTGATFPKTISQAVDTLLVHISLKQSALIKDMAKSKLVLLHHGLGTWIRNNFGLWAGNEPLLKECRDALNKNCIHPDDASMVIIDSLWARLQTKSINFIFREPMSIDSVVFDKSIENNQCDTSLARFIRMIEIPFYMFEEDIDCTLHYTVLIGENGLVESMQVKEQNPPVVYDEAVRKVFNKYRFWCIDKRLKREKVRLNFVISFSTLGGKHKFYSTDNNKRP